MVVAVVLLFNINIYCHMQPHATAAMRSLVMAIDMVFGSAAALCTCFCTRNGYMLDYVKLD